MKTLQNIRKSMFRKQLFRILEKYTMYRRTLCSFWKNLSGHFSQSPLKRSMNRSYGYASAGDRKNWLAEISPEFCIPMKHSGWPEYFMRTLYLMHKFMVLPIIPGILEIYSLYHRTLYSFWKNLSGHFSRSPLKRSMNRSYGYASAGDHKNWLAEISPEFCIPMKHSG